MFLHSIPHVSPRVGAVGFNLILYDQVLVEIPRQYFKDYNRSL